MSETLSANTLAAILIGIVLFHIALVIAGIFYRKINPLYLLAAAFILLSPISAATTIPGFYLAKWGRVYVSIMMVVIGLFGFRIFRVGLASKAMLAFIAFFVCAACWSDVPIVGMMYKGLFAVTVVAGIFLAYGARDCDELARGLRWLAVMAAFAGLVAFGVFLSDPESSLHLGRLHVLGINPNRIAQTAAPLLILCSYMAFFDRSKIWKGFGYLAAGLLVVVLLYTGSRTSVATAAVGGIIVALPLIKRPVKAAIVVAAVGIFGWVAVLNIETESVKRLMDAATFSEDTTTVFAEARAPVWQEALGHFRKSPIVGVGWACRHTDGRYSTRDLHSMYLQLLAETGLIGSSILYLCFIFALFRGVRVYMSVHRYAAISSLAALALGLLVSLFVYGVGDSGTLVGSTLNALFLGFSIGLIDRLVPLARAEMARTSVPVVIQHPITPRFPRRGHGGTEVAT